MLAKTFFFLITSFLVSTTFAGQHSIVDFGASPRENHDNTQAIQKAVDACLSDGGGTVIFPAGTWLSGTVFLKNHVSIYLSNGSTWQAVNDTTAFPYIQKEVMSRENRKPRRAMVYACDVHDMKIYGEGTINGGGDYDIFNVKKNREKDMNYFRPFGIYLVRCTDITVDGITMKNSAFWMQRYQDCDRLKLTNLTIDNHANLNNDGIDIDGCHDVLVSNCLVDASDDALVLKSEGMRGCRDVVVTNCILSSHATPLKLGTGSIGGFQRIAISNIVIRPSKSKEMIHPEKSWGGLSGIDLLCVDGGIMEDISIENVVMDSVETALFIKLGDRNSAWPGKPEATPGVARNIRISNVTARHCGPICSAITGYPGNKVENVWLSNIFISVRGNENIKDTISVIPENSDEYPYNRMFGSNLTAYGFYVRHAENIHFDQIILDIEKKDVRPAMVLDDVSNVFIHRLDAESSSGSKGEIRIKSGERIFIDSSPMIDYKQGIHLNN